MFYFLEEALRALAQGTGGNARLRIEGRGRANAPTVARKVLAGPRWNDCENLSYQDGNNTVHYFMLGYSALGGSDPLHTP